MLSSEDFRVNIVAVINGILNQYEKNKLNVKCNINTGEKHKYSHKFSFKDN